MEHLPKTYKAAAFLKANDPLSIIDVELKPPKTGEVLVKVLATGMVFYVSSKLY
jgi:Zn-dependent alcohol dehydrogenase